ncbi:MAG: 50S ribosomal protein L37ae [Candidatus Bathyarchaeota archaeon]|nr:50S ribosomal protein L37ae [Candidatus Bathyarchaeota archaeon]
MAKNKRKNIGLRGRGGATLRKRYGRIMTSLHTYHKCPSCASPSVKRESVGLWECRKCGHKFAGGAYTPSTKVGQASRRIRIPV